MSHVTYVTYVNAQVGTSAAYRAIGLPRVLLPAARLLVLLANAGAGERAVEQRRR